MTNAQLRKQAWHLFWRNRGLLWLVFLLLAAVNFGWYLISRSLPQSGWMNRVFNVIYLLLLTPVTTFGLNGLLLRLVRRKGGKISRLFDVLKPPYKLRTVAGACLVVNYTFPLTILSGLVQTTGAYSSDQAIFILIFGVCVIVACIWISLRLFLFPFLFILHHEGNVWALVKTSFQQMKGKVGNLIWFVITVYFLPFVLFIGIIILVFIGLYEPGATQSALLLFNLFAVLVQVFVIPYAVLSMAAYANNLLRADDAS